MPKLDFLPERHGFLFANVFTNVVLRLPGGKTLQTYGRCGGMCFAVLDHYLSGKHMPTCSTDTWQDSYGVPPDQHRLAKYIYLRQLDSFAVRSAARFVTWTFTPDRTSWWSKGVSDMSKIDQFTRLKRSIDSGVPVTLGLICARKFTELGQNHQVIAYGYEEQADKDKQIVHIYDVNYPKVACQLESGSQELDWKESYADLRWRGWFVQDYKPKLVQELFE